MKSSPRHGSGRQHRPPCPLATANHGRAYSRADANLETVRFPPKVDVVRGDLTIHESLETAMEGIDSVFLAWTAPRLAVAAALDRIAKQARRIVFLLSPHKTAHPFFQNRQPNPIATLHNQIEQLNRHLRACLGLPAARNVCWKCTAPMGRSDGTGDVVRWPRPGARA